MIRRPPRSTPKPSSAASDVYKRQTVFCVLTQQGQDGSQDGQDDGGPDAKILFRRTMLHWPLAFADGGLEHRQLSLVLVVKELEVNVIRLLLQGFQQFQNRRFPCKSTGGSQRERAGSLPPSRLSAEKTRKRTCHGRKTGEEDPQHGSATRQNILTVFRQS